MYATSEHYFQAQKFLPHAPDVAQRVIDANGARGAFETAHRYSARERHDWMIIRDDVMRQALRLKFGDSEMRRMLLSTEERQLVERSPHDRYWGDGGDSTGENRLGKLLMELRAVLQDHERLANVPSEQI